MKKKKKGFTLVELLAVVVVLSVLLVITVPKILEVIENAQKQAYKESVELMAHTARLQYQTGEVTGGVAKIPEGGIIYEFAEGEYTTSNTLNFKGDKPFSGKITLTEDKKIIITDLISNDKKWCAKKDANEKHARVGKRNDPGFNCKIEGEEEKIVDEVGCMLATNKDETIYYIDSPSDLYAFSQSVNSGDIDYSGKTVKVRNNLDMSKAEGECVTNFEPIGTEDKPFNGTFDGGLKTISNLKIDSSNTWVGIFGVTNGATIQGLIIEKASVKGSDDSVSIGGLIGYNNQASVVKDIQINSMEVHGISYVGGLFGYANWGVQGSNILVKNIEVYGESSVYGVASNGSHKANNTIVENVKIEATTGKSIFTHYTNDTTYILNYSVTKNKGLETESTESRLDSKEINDINMYEAAGLDTWIGGDDGSGYYFDYDKKGNIVLKSIEKDPITFTLKGSGTESDPYLIENEKHWKEVSARPLETDYYRVTNDLDFSTNKYYMLGSTNSPFQGIFDGDMKQINNVTINASSTNNIGVFGKVNEGKISNLNLNKIDINGRNNTGGIAGYLVGTYITTVKINGNVHGATNVGGLVGTNFTSTSYVDEIQVTNMVVDGDISVGGLTGGTSWGVNNNNVLVKNIEIYGNDTVFGTTSNSNSDANNTVIENIKIEAPTNKSIYTHHTDDTTYILNYSITNNKGEETESTESRLDSKEINDINMYEAAGLDTWIGGDSNTTDYYFDYDSNNSIVLKSTKKDPITFTLKGSGTESDPYLIENEKHWKEVSARPLEPDYYKVTNDLDFNTNKYYMLGSANAPFQGTFNGDMKQISNITINASSADNIGVFGKVNEVTISKLNLNKININGRNNTGGVVGYFTGPSYLKTIIVNGNVNGGMYTGGLVGYNISAISYIDEVEITNMIVKGSNSVGGLNGYGNWGITSNDILVKNIEIYGSEYVNITSPNSSCRTKKAVYENSKLVATTSKSVYTGWSNDEKYLINSTVILSVGTENEDISTYNDSANLGNLPYYANMLETLYTGDTNNTGYFFDYDPSKNGIYLKKAYSLTFTSPPSDDTEDTNTEGGGTEADNCYITISCSGSGKYRNCYINYYENGVNEAPVLNGFNFNLTQGSSCAAYSLSNTPSGANFYVKKKSSSSCSVTFRASTSADCATTTYKTISF